MADIMKFCANLLVTKKNILMQDHRYQPDDSWQVKEKKCKRQCLRGSRGERRRRCERRCSRMQDEMSHHEEKGARWDVKGDAPGCKIQLAAMWYLFSHMFKIKMCSVVFCWGLFPFSSRNSGACNMQISVSWAQMTVESAFLSNLYDVQSRLFSSKKTVEKFVQFFIHTFEYKLGLIFNQFVIMDPNHPLSNVGEKKIIQEGKTFSFILFSLSIAISSPLGVQNNVLATDIKCLAQSIWIILAPLHLLHKSTYQSTSNREIQLI